MENIDKERINKNINEAYDGQTEKVKKLLESAKRNLEMQRPTVDYKIDKEKSNKFHMVSRVVSRKKESEKNLQNAIESKLEEMNSKLQIHSKNLDVIFENVADNTNKEKEVLEGLTNNQAENTYEIIKNVQKASEQNERAIKNMKDEIQKHIEDTYLEAEKRIIESQTTSVEQILKNTADIAQNQEMLSLQKQVKEEILKNQDELEKSLLTANSFTETNILNKQNQVKNQMEILQVNLEEKMKKMQQENIRILEQTKQEIMQTYQKENKHSITTLLEERNNYLKELEEKDMQIRQLNYKIYEYEEKLEKEIAKRERLSLFAAFFKKDQEVEETPVYTSQILSYVYNE